MIIRILGEGQYDVADDRLDELNALDDQVQAAVESGAAERLPSALRELLDAVRAVGTPLPGGTLTVSEFVLPAEDTDLGQVRALLGDEGLLPG